MEILPSFQGIGGLGGLSTSIQDKGSRDSEAALLVHTISSLSFQDREYMTDFRCINLLYAIDIVLLETHYRREKSEKCISTERVRCK